MNLEFEDTNRTSPSPLNGLNGERAGVGMVQRALSGSWFQYTFDIAGLAYP